MVCPCYESFVVIVLFPFFSYCSDYDVLFHRFEALFHGFYDFWQYKVYDCCVITVMLLERPAQVQLSEGQQLCVVCQDVANGLHFGAITCEGCKVWIRLLL